MNTNTTTIFQTPDFPSFVILIRAMNATDKFYSGIADGLTVDSKEKADLFTDSGAHLVLAKALEYSYVKFQGAKIVHITLADKPDPVTIKFHIQQGNKKIQDAVYVRIIERFPEAKIESSYIGAFTSDYCWVQGASINDALWIETEVRAIMGEEYQRVTVEAFEYA